MKKFVTFLVLIVIIIAGVNFGMQAVRSANDSEAIMPVASENAGSIENDEVVSEKKIPGIPQRLSIPKINVDASIESVGLDKDKKMDVPQDSDNVAWYSLGAKPGMTGSAVVAGHKDEQDGSPSVFWDVKKLVVGDKITVVDEKGDEYTFSVIEKAEYPDAAFPLQKVFNGPKDRSVLNLITCEGIWNTKTRNYSHRTVIYSQLDE